MKNDLHDGKRFDSTRRLRLAALIAGALGAAAIVLVLGVSARPEPAAAGALAAPAKSSDGVLEFSLAADRRHLLRGGDGRVRLELQLRAFEAPGSPVRSPTDFVVVLDRSGSMQDFGKMTAAREAVSGLLERLDESDRFALVIYSDRAEVPIALAAATAPRKAQWQRLVQEIGPLGGTALSLGIDRGIDLLADRRQASAAARLVLISDGLANQGDTSRAGLLERAAGVAALAAPLTAVGVGDDFDENLMGALADSGGGNFYFLRDAIALAEVFAGELGATRETVAQAVEVEIALPAGARLLDAAGYPIERQGHRAVFRPGSLFAGQERRLWLTLEVGDGPGAHRDLGKVAVNYRAGGRQRLLKPLPAPDVTVVTDEATFLAGLDRERWGQAVIEEDYGQLQQKVAEEVKAGRRDAAKAEIAAYAGKYKQLNSTVQNPELERNLAAAEQMDAKVDEAFAGERQEEKRNLLSKTSQSAGWESRRAGAKKHLPRRPSNRTAKRPSTKSQDRDLRGRAPRHV